MKHDDIGLGSHIGDSNRMVKCICSVHSFSISFSICKSHVSCEQVKTSNQRLTIFEKLEILDYAKSVRDQHEEALASVRNSKKKVHKKQRRYIKGLNLNKSCQRKFGAKMGRIKICQLKRQAEVQKWHLLTEVQQKKTYQLSDSMKVALGLGSVKGWKALTPGQIAEEVQKVEKLKRWNVPAKVLEEKGCSQTWYDTVLPSPKSLVVWSMTMIVLPPEVHLIHAFHV